MTMESRAPAYGEILDHWARVRRRSDILLECLGGTHERDERLLALIEAQGAMVTHLLSERTPTRKQNDLVRAWRQELARARECVDHDSIDDGCGRLKHDGE